VGHAFRHDIYAVYSSGVSTPEDVKLTNAVTVECVVLW